MAVMTTSSSPAALNHQLEVVARKRIFFGHQSVGQNILDGVRELVACTPGTSLNIISSEDPSNISGPGLFEAKIGKNTDPESKNLSFAAILQKGFGRQVGVAFYKYCYVDVTAATDVQKMFLQYQLNVDGLKAQYPAIQFVHVTIPLTTVEPAAKAWLKSVLNRRTERETSLRRNEFNRLLRETYQEDPIFDLAEIESTHPDGSSSFFVSDGQQVYTLYPEYATDGGHLNTLGQRRAAEALIGLLARI